MNFRKLINKKFRHSGEGVQAVGDVQAAIAANVGRKGSASKMSTRQSTRIVQRSGETVVSESHQESTEGGPDERQEA